eukprot:8368024-Pyramimonas_sp.AAC.1
MPRGLLSVPADVAGDACLLVLPEQPRHLARVEQVVDILHKALLHNLRVGEQKHNRLAVHAPRLVQILQVLAEVVAGVAESITISTQSVEFTVRG